MHTLEECAHSQRTAQRMPDWSRLLGLREERGSGREGVLGGKGSSA